MSAKRDSKLFVVLSLLGLILSSCSNDGQGSEASSYETESSSIEVSSSSEAKTSKTSFSPRDRRTVYTVNIYQCFYYPDEKRYGTPKFDIQVKYEMFEPFFEDADAFRKLKSQCHPSGEFYYSHPGGAYIMIGFFYDVTCKHEIMYGDPVTSNSSIYYYCQ